MAHSRARWVALFGGLGLLAALSAAHGQVMIKRLGQTPTQVPEDKAPAGANRLLERLGTSHFRHGSRILCLAYSPSGQVLAAGGGADPVRVWDVETGQEKFRCPETWVNALAFTPRGSILATAGAFKSVRLWAVANGKEEGKLEGHTAPIKAMVMSPDGTLLATGGQDGTIILWELLTKKSIVTLKGHTDEVTALAFSPDSTLLVSGSTDRSLRVWDTDTNKLKKMLDGGCGVQAVAFAADGNTVFSGGDDYNIRVFDVQAGKQTANIKAHRGIVASLVVSRDGKTLISGAHDGTIRLWDVAGGTKERRAIRRHRGDSDALALTKDGQFVATAGLNNTIRIFRTADGSEVTRTDSPQAGLGALARSADGRWLVSASATGVLYLWDAHARKLVRSWPTNQAGEVVMAFSPDGKSIVTGSDSIHVWDAQTGQEAGQLPVKQGETVLSLAFAPDGKTLAVGARNHVVTLWDWNDRKPIRTLAYDKHHPYALAFARDGALLGVSGGSAVAVWETATGKEVQRFECKEGPAGTLPDVAALAFAPDGKTLAVACYDAVVRLFDFAAGKQLRECEGHVSVPYGLAFSSDGRVIVTGSFDSTVRLWETFSGQPIAVLQGHAGPVHGIALAPDNRTVYSASADTTVLVWDATGFGKAGLPQTPLGAADLEKTWSDLASENPGPAHLAAWGLIARPRDAIAFLSKKVYLEDVERVEELLKNLDSEDFKKRNVAFVELQGKGRWLEGRLREALVQPPSLEYQRRIEQLLGKLAVPGALSLRQEQLRVGRVMFVLEQVGGNEALDMFRKLEKGAPEKAFREEARVSLARLNGTK